MSNCSKTDSGYKKAFKKNEKTKFREEDANDQSIVSVLVPISLDQQHFQPANYHCHNKFHLAIGRLYIQPAPDQARHCCQQKLYVINCPFQEKYCWMISLNFTVNTCIFYFVLSRHQQTSGWKYIKYPSLWLLLFPQNVIDRIQTKYRNVLCWFSKHT